MRSRLRLYPVEFIVPRHSIEEQTFAIVKAQVADPDLIQTGKFLNILITAVTNWVRTNKNGRRAWAKSQQDFNIGDLAHYIDSPGLRRALVLHNIYDLTIQIISDLKTSPWIFDTTLVDTMQLDQ